MGRHAARSASMRRRTASWCSLRARTSSAVDATRGSSGGRLPAPTVRSPLASPDLLSVDPVVASSLCLARRKCVMACCFVRNDSRVCMFRICSSKPHGQPGRLCSPGTCRPGNSRMKFAALARAAGALYWQPLLGSSRHGALFLDRSPRPLSTKCLVHPSHARQAPCAGSRCWRSGNVRCGADSPLPPLLLRPPPLPLLRLPRPHGPRRPQARRSLQRGRRGVRPRGARPGPRARARWRACSPGRPRQAVCRVATCGRRNPP